MLKKKLFIMMSALALSAATIPVASAQTFSEQQVTGFDNFGNRVTRTQVFRTDAFGNRVAGERIVKTDAFGNRIVRTVRMNSFGQRIVNTTVVNGGF